MFLQFNADRSQGWVMNQNCVGVCCVVWSSRHNRNLENFWALYWHKLCQTQPHSLAAMHLSAYLQEACYWLQKISTGFVSTQYTLADCFQIAIAKVDKVIRILTPNRV